MARREFIGGPNFSGRSGKLLEMPRAKAAPSFFIGPYAEAALSGLSSTVADEIALYRAPRIDRNRPTFSYLAVADSQKRQPQSLSGGEQVLLALQCFSMSAFEQLAIDTALEQLDAEYRGLATDYLGSGGFDVAVIDNRMLLPAEWSCTQMPAIVSEFACRWHDLVPGITPAAAPEIAIRNLSFKYRTGNDIFRDVELALTPGAAYRLHGRNGAGKTTLLKILVGVLAPSSGEIKLNGKAYKPWNDGNRMLALATQNPDHQWCGATLREDLARRCRAHATKNDAAVPNERRLAALAGMLGVRSLDQHLYELPLAARKRVSWLWPFAGAHPWIMLDEPTIGQDDDTRAHLAVAIAQLCAAGYGVIFVTHDDGFASRVPHRRLRVSDMSVAVD